MLSFFTQILIFQTGRKVEVLLQAKGTNPNTGFSWQHPEIVQYDFDKVSAMPLDANQLFHIVHYLSPQKINFSIWLGKVQALSIVEDNICIEGELEQDLGLKF